MHVQPRQAWSTRARVCTGARHTHGSSPPTPQIHQGAGLALLKALQETRMSQRSGHKKDSPGPCLPGTCPPPCLPPPPTPAMCPSHWCNKFSAILPSRGIGDRVR
ncbi:unnamed protein product [Rangifer tarandus platyrhynchus]|uniref:Uncharacterized protein n=1 Tax=Rangifer tarandus platyrhynchus TaxID=3082113 RepID=A0ABN8XV25_RANTA|nr:unnamed protein product [Rangifer tarandus platyrhynchus]